VVDCKVVEAVADSNELLQAKDYEQDRKTSGKQGGSRDGIEVSGLDR
jgi:hypothetical protein